MDSHSYIELRDLAVCRLTVFNAQRGGEPARLVISEWQDAENGSWLDPKRLQVAATDKELTMFRNLKVRYQGGKGNNHLVPVHSRCCGSDEDTELRISSGHGWHSLTKSVHVSSHADVSNTREWLAGRSTCVHRCNG